METTKDFDFILSVVRDPTTMFSANEKDSTSGDPKTKAVEDQRHAVEEVDYDMRPWTACWTRKIIFRQCGR